MKPVALALVFAALAVAQPPDLRMDILGAAGSLVLAVPDFRGDAQSQPLMPAFNQTLWLDLEDSAFFQMAPKTHYPLALPQLPADLRQPRDWSGPPVGANYLAMGYSAVQNGALLVRGFLLGLGGAAPAEVFEKRYGMAVDTEGARKAAHQFAADILAHFGVPSVFGTHIYFVRESRPAPDRLTEIWVMDPDGANQRRLVSGRAIYTQPAVSPDGTKIACVEVYPRPALLLFSADTGRALPFQNAKDLTAIASPSFSPDGKQLLFAESINGRGMQLTMANLDGSGQRALTGLTTTDAEPKLNPKTGAQIAFVSGRAGREQIYSMNLDGTMGERVSAGTGEASNPDWHPSGQFLAFAWTRGYAAGAWNIFVQNLGTGHVDQLTSEAGKNENPVWAPDGRHLVFMSTRSGRKQIWSMWADGTHLRQLTSTGVNATPAWGR